VAAQAGRVGAFETAAAQVAVGYSLPIGDG